MNKFHWDVVYRNVDSGNHHKENVRAKDPDDAVAFVADSIKRSFGLTDTQFDKRFRLVSVVRRA